MSTGSQPPEPAEPGVQLSETGVWLSQDGAWEWDGANWVPRVADVVWLGRLIGFSNRDLDANRAGRLTFGQAAGLWLWALIWSGLGILLVGIALASTLPESIWVRVFVGPIVFTIAVYFCWRGFAAAVDAVSGAVAVTSGTLYKRWDSDDDAPWQGAGYYYVGVGGVERKLYKSAGERVPVGIYCRAYYAYGSNRLLSVEPAASVDEYAFDPTGKTWARAAPWWGHGDRRHFLPGGWFGLCGRRRSKPTNRLDCGRCVAAVGWRHLAERNCLAHLA
jgi:hypothetical protein